MAGFHFNLTVPLNVLSLSIKLILVTCTILMITLLFRATLIVPKAMDIKIKVLLIASLIPQILDLIIYFAPVSNQVISLFHFLDFCPLNAFIYLQFEVLQIFRYILSL